MRKTACKLWMRHAQDREGWQMTVLRSATLEIQLQYWFHKSIKDDFNVPTHKNANISGLRFFFFLINERIFYVGNYNFYTPSPISLIGPWMKSTVGCVFLNPHLNHFKFQSFCNEALIGYKMAILMAQTKTLNMFFNVCQAILYRNSSLAFAAVVMSTPELTILWRSRYNRLLQLKIDTIGSKNNNKKTW